MSFSAAASTSSCAPSSSVDSKSDSKISSSSKFHRVGTETHGSPWVMLTLSNGEVLVLFYVHAEILYLELRKSSLHAVSRGAPLGTTCNQRVLHFTFSHDQTRRKGIEDDADVGESRKGPACESSRFGLNKPKQRPTVAGAGVHRGCFSSATLLRLQAPLSPWFSTSYRLNVWIKMARKIKTIPGPSRLSLMLARLKAEPRLLLPNLKSLKLTYAFRNDHFGAR